MQPITLDLFLNDTTLILKRGPVTLAQADFHWADSSVSTGMDLTTFQKAVETPQSPPDSFLQDFGHKLYQALFPAAIQTAWDAVLKSAPRNQPVHLRLRIDPEAKRRWGRLPWEYLHDGTDWLLRRKGLRFSRLAPGVDERPFPKLDEPLRLLIMVCAPQDQPEHLRLNARVEEDLIQQATLEAYRSGELEVYFAPNGRLDTLKDQLQTVRPHILHLSTHGGFDGQTGRILMESPEGRTVHITHDEIIHILSELESLRMAVFSACQTARVSATSGFSDLGRRLLAEAGLGAVVAMGFSVSEEGANAFISGLYHAAVEGIGLDAAATRARRAIPEARELGMPVLYLSDPGALQLDPDGVRKNQRSYPLALDALGQHPTFVGRSVELHSLQTHLDPKRGDWQAAVIYGPGGMGKTALVRRMAVRSFGIFQGALALRMAPQTTIWGVLNAFRGFFSRYQHLWGQVAVDRAVSLLNQPPEAVRLDDRVRCLAEALAALPLLVIFDNCEDILPEGFHLSCARQAEGDEDTLIVDRALLGVLARLVLRGGGPGGSRFIFTSRTDFSLADLADDAAVQEQIQQSVRVLLLELEEFGFRESLYLMDALPELRGLPIRLTEEEKTRGLDPLTRLTLFERIGGHPYYLHLFDRRAAQKGGPVAAWQALPDLEKEILQHTLLEAAIENLPKRARALLKQGSVIQTPTPMEGWAYLLGDEVDCMPQVADELDALRGSGLVMAFPEGAYQPYTLAAQRIRVGMAAEEVRASQVRLGDFWWVRRKETHDINDPLRAWNYRMLAGDVWGSYEIFNNLFPTLDRWGYWSLCLKMGKSMLPLLPQGLQIAELLHNLGMIEQRQRHYQTAKLYFQKSLKMNKKLCNSSGVAITMFHLGIFERELGRNATAIEHFEEALIIFKALTNRWGLASVLGELGICYHEQERYEIAKDFYEKALKIFEELGELNGTARMFHQLGRIAQEKEQYKIAKDYYQKTLEIEEKTGDLAGIASTLNNLGGIEQQKINYSEAFEYYQRSLQIFKKLGDIVGEANVLHNIGQLLEEEGEFEGAVIFTARAFNIFLQLGLPQQQLGLRVLVNLHNKMSKQKFLMRLVDAIGSENAKMLFNFIDKNLFDNDMTEVGNGNHLMIEIQRSVQHAMTKSPQIKTTLWHDLQVHIGVANVAGKEGLTKYLSTLQALLEGWQTEDLSERVPEVYQTAWKELLKSIENHENQHAETD